MNSNIAENVIRKWLSFTVRQHSPEEITGRERQKNQAHSLAGLVLEIFHSGSGSHPWR
ncbi:MAG: hypothetical protein HDT15_09820 [Oscillibacter sp.]|nr:hypothetical protein [Oscillibacter sp.]